MSSCPWQGVEIVFRCSHQKLTRCLAAVQLSIKPKKHENPHITSILNQFIYFDRKCSQYNCKKLSCFANFLDISLFDNFAFSTWNKFKNVLNVFMGLWTTLPLFNSFFLWLRLQRKVFLVCKSGTISVGALNFARILLQISKPFFRTLLVQLDGTLRSYYDPHLSKTCIIYSNVVFLKGIKVYRNEGFHCDYCWKVYSVLLSGSLLKNVSKHNLLEKMFWSFWAVSKWMVILVI